MLSPPSLGPRLLVLSSLLAGVLSDCGPPPVIHNAVPKNNIEGASFPPGSTVIYKCVGNFFNVYGKIDVVTCLRDSKWTHIEQFCVGSCWSPPRSAFAQVKKGERKDYYIANTTVAYICRKGYDTIPEITPVITCRENYTWTQIPAFCKGKSCGDPGKPEHGDAVILTNFLYLAKVNFTCEDGYILNGSPTTQCQWKKDHVEWTHKPPKCQRPIEEPTEDRTTKTTTGQTVSPPRSSATNNTGPHLRILLYVSLLTMAVVLTVGIIVFLKNVFENERSYSNQGTLNHAVLLSAEIGNSTAIVNLKSRELLS